MLDYRGLREEAFNANMKLNELELVLFTFGNASAVDRHNGVFAIKPSGVLYKDLSPEKMVIVDYNGETVSGDLRPSSDTNTHAVLYKHWTSIGGIVHTHSTYATAWAQSQKDIPIMGTTHADYLEIDVPCVPIMEDAMIEKNYEYETGVQIINYFISKSYVPTEIEMVTMSNHGPFTWGDNVEKAVHNSALLEQIAKIAWLTKSINPQAPKLKQSLINKHFQRKHGRDAYYGQKKDK
tara:strand:+ start:455 stop:1165 length:711 start_codon:yes stop_codon:yes gene_type:complete